MDYNEYRAQRKTELAKNTPHLNDNWIIQYLYEYLVEVNVHDGEENIALNFFEHHLRDNQLAFILLSEFLLNEDYGGSDSQLGAAVILRKMDRSTLKANRELVLMVQKNEVYWKRPCNENDDLKWLND